MSFIILTNTSSAGLLSSPESESGLLSNNYNSGDMGGLFSMINDNGGFDAFGGKDFFGSLDLSSLNESFFASIQQAETAGSVAYNTAETVGSVAFNTAETVGSVACAGADAGSSCGSDGGGSFSSFC